MRECYKGSAVVTLLARLFTLVAAALVPALAIQAYNEFDRRHARQLEVQNQVLTVARLAAADQQQIVQEIHQVLVVLSELEPIKAKDAPRCNALLAAMKPRFPAFMTVIVTDLRGISFCGTVDNHRQVDVSKREYFANAIGLSEFAVGEFAIGVASGRKIIQFALPFYDDNSDMSGVIIASLGLDWLSDYIARKGAPEGGALAIADRNGTYLARYPNNDRFVGTKMPSDKFPTRDGQGAADTMDVDGVQRIEGYSALEADSGDLIVSFGLDKALAFSEIQRQTLSDILLIVVSTSLVLLLISLGARQFIHRPLGHLVDAANQWRLGNFTRRVDIGGNSEIARVGSAFNTMADALKHRDQELEHRQQELSRAKEAAEVAAAEITTIFESTRDSVLIIDRDCRVTYLNGPAWEQVGKERDVIGMNVVQALPEAVGMEVLKEIQEAVSAQRPASAEAFCGARNIWYAIDAFPSSQGFAVFIRNITEHKYALEARRLIEEQLHQSQKMESVGQLTGGVAHDFNNLLAVASGNLELVETATDFGKVRQFVAAARRAIDRGAKLTAQLLAFSRRQTLNPKLVNASQLISEFQGLIRQAVGAESEVKLLAEDELWLCNVDPTQLENALLNLALNAHDAMPDGGVLQIETRNIIVGEGDVTGCAAGQYVILSVRDTGCGMPPEVADRVFEPFFTTKEIGKGTGLGLSMVYGFVRQSGGHIAVESEPNVGTKFSLYLPRAVERPDAEEQTRQCPAIATASERILLVDDNEDMLEVTSTMLTTCGYQVFAARSGAEALRVIESGQEFEILFSDIVMPDGMSGVDLAREAKRLNESIKVLLTSGYASEVLERRKAVDEFPIIEKPFRFSDLARRLHALLHGS